MEGRAGLTEYKACSKEGRYYGQYDLEQLPYIHFGE